MTENLVQVIRKCPTCKGNDAYLLQQLKLVLPSDHPFENHYRAVLCSTCSTFFCDTAVTEEKLNHYYTSLAKYQDKTVGTGGATNPFDLERFRKVAAMIEKHAPSKEIKILDIGCANGGALSVLKEIGFQQLYGIDPSPDCAEETRSKLGAKTRVGGISSITQFETEFDMVILSHVVEHLLNPAEAISLVQKVLSKDGLLYIEVPDPARFHQYETTPFQEFNTEHINHFGKTALRSLVESCGFETIASQSDINTIANNTDYPVEKGIWKKSNQATRTWHFDQKLYDALKEYTRISNDALTAISRSLKENLGNAFAIWGAGQFCYKILALPAFNQTKPKQIIDNNSVNWGRTLMGVPIQKSSALEQNLDAIVIATMINPTPIQNQLAVLAPQTKPVILTQIDCEMNLRRKKN